MGLSRVALGSDQLDLLERGREGRGGEGRGREGEGGEGRGREVMSMQHANIKIHCTVIVIFVNL